VQPKTQFVVNPTSGRGKVAARLTDLTAAARRFGGEFHLTNSVADLRTAVARARDRGDERVVVVGGDGSVHHAVQELVGSDTALAPIPLGRGNDFSTSVGIPEDFGVALGLAVESRTRRVDLGQVADGHGTRVHFAVHCGVGIDSLSARLANRQKLFRGALGYPLAAVAVLARFKPPVYTIEHDAGTWQGQGMSFVTANCWRFGAGMKIAPEAKVDDGLLDLVWIKKAFKPRMIPLLIKVYDGKHVGHPAVQMIRSSRVRLSLSHNLPIYGDGESMLSVGEEPVEISVVAKGLRVVAPG